MMWSDRTWNDAVAEIQCSFICEWDASVKIPGKITGKITTSVTGQNSPIVGATVTVLETGQSVETGTDGNYIFNDILEGEYTVKVQMNGFNTLQLMNVAITGGNTTEIPAKEMFFECGVKGDMNDDGKISLEEAIKTLQIVSGIKYGPPDPDGMLSDVK